MVCGRGCSFGWDVRCCCEPGCDKKNTMKQFNNCPKKLDTIYFHMGNDYNVYNYLEDVKDINYKTIRNATKMIHRGIQLNCMECSDLLMMIKNDKADYDDYCLSLH